MNCPKCGTNLAPEATVCPTCGNVIQQTNSAQSQIPGQPPVRKAPFGVWKLVSGILSIVLFILVMFQSCAAGISNTLENNGEVGGSAGAIVGIMLLAGGIVSIVVRNSLGKGGNIAIIVMYGLAALVGYLLAGSYSDLYIWSTWCLICAILAIVPLVKNKSTNK